MIIVPIEKKISWKQAPIVTAVLIFLNVLTFIVWQTQDERKVASLTEQHKDSILPKMEYDNFINYLYQSDQIPLAQAIEQQWNDGDKNAIYPHILVDLGYILWLNQTDLSFWGEKEYGPWLREHKKVEAQIREISYIKYGLTPAESRPLTLFTYQFLHHDWSQLVGNMIFLAIVGIGVEAAIGSFHFLVAYILCALLASLTYLAFNGASPIPLVGASGAISAILGMYIAIYELHKIRFFYFVIFYWGYFTAPALVIAPAWILIEVLQLIINPEANTGYSAIVGGLSAGVAYIYAFRRWILVKDSPSLEASDTDQAYRTQLNDALKQISIFNFSAARVQLESLSKAHPKHIQLKIQRYHVEKMHKNQTTIDTLVLDIFQHGVHHHQYLESVHDLYCDYLSQEHSAVIPFDLNIKLLLVFIQLKQLDTAKKIVKQLMTEPNDDAMLAKALYSLSKALERQGLSDEAYRYENMAKKLQSTTQPPST